MIAFFEDNDLSPYDTLRDSITSVSNRLNKRMDAVAAILKNIEKTQLIPTRELLESLFQEEEETMLIERNHFEEESLQSIDERLYSHYYNKYEATRKELNQLKSDLNNMMDNVKYVKNTFGRDYYRLDIS